ncbi:ATP-binding cassette domain-containing protein [Novosphingobium pentaromativorans]|uniref:ABC-2 type transport system ATP-binding protein n=1 Tax=Novosphingobium pentaromativorans US6-1 TaxID=1088721 RepID=G6EIX0_9SPHN|nr:ATP-binding cassette domain-containing protein [Novosphingobium pentaromativorans]AIT78931.1 ABC transporter ATP-binding protein [Novosphingobium pentaromativorans US6-1]EHJ58729.1 ABC-2 type transport system ATP-binding protein [Novosphingobium pentaromativorans US6-1]
MSQAVATVVSEGLRKEFAAPDGTPFNAIDSVSLSVRPGTLSAFVGPDGAGKTTMMRMMAGLLAPDDGALSVLGIDVRQDPQEVQNRISYMPQRFGLYEDLSVQENLDLYADLHGVPLDERKERFARMLDMTDMARFTERPAGKLSGGMKQKLGLACTLVRVPELLLLDEPSVGVDPLSRRDLWQIIEQLIADEGLSVVVSTAYMDEAERCDEIFVLNKGRLLAQGNPDQLRSKARGLTYLAVPAQGMLARNLQARLIDARDRIVDAVPRGGAVRLIRSPHHDLSVDAGLLEGAQVEPREAELEDAFMLLLREHETRGEAHRPPPLAAAAKGHDRTATGKEDGREREVMIRVRDLVRRFGDFTAVANTTFDVAKGEIFGLLGPNGAGKTTTFRMLCGLLPATSGQLDVAGVNLRTARAAARARIGYVAQKFSLYSNLSVRENLEFFGGAYGLRGKMLRRRVDETLERFNLDASATCGLLPLGYKQRLAMATGLIHEPDILFLDEPTSGIDPLARRAFWRTITALSDEGVTIIVTTHFMEEAEYCDRIAIQDAGHLLALGTPREVREQAGNGEADDMDRAFIAIVEQGRARASSERAAA